MPIDKNKQDEKINKNDLETEQPLSEKDEVKKAEKRTQDLQKKGGSIKKK